MSVSRIMDLVREGKITTAQGALLMELRRRIAWSRRPLWYRAGAVMLRALFG